MDLMDHKKGMVNIPSYIEDESYRYFMPIIQIKIEGKGNGIRTNFPNILDVAAALRIPPEYIVKWFAIENGKNALFKNDQFMTTGKLEM